MEKNDILFSKLDLISYLLILNLRVSNDLDDKSIKNIVLLLAKSGCQWRDISNFLNISPNTISKLIKK
jgi:hypothetical protein